MPVSQTLNASRNATWAPTIIIPYDGPALPLAGAHIALQVRTTGGAPNAPLVDIPGIPFVDALVAGAPGQDDEERELALALPDTDLSAVPSAAPTGQDDSYEYDIRITYADGATEVPVGGAFILAQGVTR